MIAKVQVKNEQVDFIVDGEVVASTRENYPKIPKNYITGGIMFGFEKEINLKYKTHILENVGEYTYLCVDSDGYVEII